MTAGRSRALGSLAGLDDCESRADPVQEPVAARRPSRAARGGRPVAANAEAVSVFGVPSFPRVLLFDSDRNEGLAIANDMSLARLGAKVTVVTTREATSALDGNSMDVGLINLSDQRFDGLAFGAELSARFPWIQTVFWFDEIRGAPTAIAAREMGVRRIVARRYLAAWLEDALPNLVCMARARWEHLHAERALPPIPGPLSDDECLNTPLPEAERCFREIYLRRLLSISPSHASAARKAGLPYTTFCSMLKKLDLL